eukprot:CAMPEP_0182576552 /NCGR_PEP_ID=MMETSP1324-20130603/34303_1 /TAXON_ID=236786 /ORGANISM="Florenciella sp., Strain RCC1587" /LENGTH=195 /DNA_ID=CAMNT_0024792271 /DNA_START=45 /DNA_END=628 /DNA_ORIENTATION=+
MSYTRTQRCYLYVTSDDVLHGQLVNGRFTPYPQVGDVDPASLAAAGDCTLLGTVTDVNKARRLMLTLLSTEAPPAGSRPCPLDQLWDDARGPRLANELKYCNGLSRTKLRTKVLGGVGGVAINVAGTTFEDRPELIAQAKTMNASVATLVPQPKNKFDDKAVAIQIDGVGIIGMVPNTQTASIVSPPAQKPPALP